MTFGEKLYQLRKTHGFSQEVLADKLNTSRQAVSKWENNNGYPETEKIILLAKIFQVSLDDLLMEDHGMASKAGGAEGDSENQRAEKGERERGYYVNRHVSKSERENGYYVNREMANGFLLYYRKKFLWISMACGIILGCNGASYSSTEPGFYELRVEPVLTTLSAVALLSIVFYIILKQNPYRNLRKKELVFSEDVGRELQEEFFRLKKVLLAGIVFGLAVVGLYELYFSYSISSTWETLYLLSDAEILRDNLWYMILVGICGFVTIFCAGVYWSYSTLLRNRWEEK